jgi:hypothetical protein
MNMKRLVIVIVTISFFSLYFSSCYYDSEEVLYPVFKCDTINVTYTKNISKIMAGYCTGCHNDSYSESGVILTTYGNVQANEVRINNAIKHIGGGTPMPPGGKLSDCMILQWDLWLKDEMPK